MARPKSIAVIPDGNRRYAAKNRLRIEQAYRKGFEKVEELVKWMEDSGIEKASFWALSLENYANRSRTELRILFKLMRGKIEDALKRKYFKERKISISFFGKLDLLPDDLRKSMRELEKMTSNGTRQLSIAVAYSGREEILQAAKNLATEYAQNKEKIQSMTEIDFAQKLYFHDSPDLIIRTGDVSRLSGFMPWQNAYSELYFSKKLWPEFGRRDFDKAVEFYAQSQRRFGR